MFEWFRFGLCAFFFTVGLIALFISISGVFRLEYALNRLHSSAITDTLVLMCFLSGCIIASGVNITSAKLVAVIVIQWCTSPLVSHMFVKAKLHTDDKVSLFCRLPDEETASSDNKDKENNQ